jgi:hypothetical protein
MRLSMKLPRLIRTAEGFSTARLYTVESGGKAFYGGGMDDSPGVMNSFSRAGQYSCTLRYRRRSQRQTEGFII